MAQQARMLTILMAEDDEDDRLMAQEAFDESDLASDLRFVEDGEELMDYLHGRGQFSDPQRAPQPGVILLDLNMPKKDGRESLREIKNDEHLCHIPIIVLTTSKSDDDVADAYANGVNSYIRKPMTFDGMVQILQRIGDYWFDTVELPPSRLLQAD